MENPLASIQEPDGAWLNIYIRKGPHGSPLYYAERERDGEITKPQNDMSAEECIGYLAHVGHSLAYQVRNLSK